ncbi:MAG: hypothetical protein VB092_09965 [Oscillospiraceae bacterium]|nr:hypothetical protein [Oscillospiraceae bacterium]
MSAEIKNHPGSRWKRALRAFPATALLLAAVGGLGWLIWLFRTTAFLPQWLAITLCVLCAAAMIFSVAFYKCYLSSRK